MGIISSSRTQDALYWPKIGDDRYGNPGFGSLLEVLVRWDDKAVVFRDAEGEETVSDAIVMVDRKMPIGSALWLGSLHEFLYDQSGDRSKPLDTDGVKLIRQFQTTPKLGVKKMTSANTLRQAYL